MDVYGYALLLLSKRDYFEAELRNILSKKFPDDNPEETIELLKQSRYLNDERALVSFVRWQVTSGHGPYYIKERLRLKGVNKTVQEIKYAAYNSELDLDEVVRRLVKKYIGKRKKQPPQMLTRACANYLAMRGFDVSAILKIIKEVTRDESDFFEGC